MTTQPELPAGARHLVRPDGSVLVPSSVAGEVLRMLVRDLDAQARANGGQPSPAARRLLWALHAAAVEADERPTFPNETPGPAPATVEMDVNEAAALLECSPQYVRALARAGRVRARRASRVWLLDRASLDAYRRGESPCPRHSPDAAAARTTP